MRDGIKSGIQNMIRSRSTENMNNILKNFSLEDRQIIIQKVCEINKEKESKNA